MLSGQMDLPVRSVSPRARETRILIVEDDFEAASATAKLLVSKGYSARIAATAVEALRRPAAESFALALVDISLGGELDGVDVAEWLSRLYGIRIVFATSAADDDVLTRALGVNPAAYLVKPIEPLQLYSAVTLAIGRLPDEGASETVSDQQAAFLRRKFDQIRDAVEEVRLVERMAVKRYGQVASGIEDLSPREWQIMRDLIRTPSIESIATRRNLSTHTVQNHVKAIFRKLDVHSTAELLSLLLAD